MFLTLGSTPFTIVLMLGGAALYAIRNPEEVKGFVNYIMAPLWDHYSDRRIKALHPAVQAKARELIYRADQELGIKLRVTSGNRTYDEQEDLYAKGRTVAGKIVTWVRGGYSFHNYGLAIDVVEIKDGKALWNNPNWEIIGQLGESIGFEWGGRWNKPDKPHFQWTMGYTTEQLKSTWEGQGRPDYVALG